MLLSKSIHTVLVVLVLLAALVTVVALSWTRIETLPLGPLFTYRCNTLTEQAGGDTFRVLTTTNYYAQALADQLCRSPGLAVRFEAVEISWQPRGQLTTRELTDQHFDLLWNRERVLKGLLANYEAYYATLQQTPDYSVYWLSNRDKPELSQAYFEGKRIGLLQDSQSQSSFQLPMGQLKAADIRLQDRQLHFFTDRVALYRAFSQGEIDVISGLKWVGEREVPPEQRLVIAENRPTGAWFVSRQVLDAGLRCELAESMTVLKPLYAHIDPAFETRFPECEGL
ncbi:hypothetical protein [Marinobacter fonticola]|uniref:hypothetical protein n=1 Tax=Marinobacter fonticola TaxID=2603215 RepID=UPI0011E696C4|nr:hypothetical protein [Marinobacter fonticola]